MKNSILIMLSFISAFSFANEVINQDSSQLTQQKSALESLKTAGKVTQVSEKSINLETPVDTGGIDSGELGKRPIK